MITSCNQLWPRSAPGSILITNFSYLPGSNIDRSTELKIRERFLQIISSSEHARQIDIKIDSMAITNYSINRDSLRKQALELGCQFIFTGQLDLIGAQSWILSMEILSVKPEVPDTLISPDPGQFKLEGTLTDLLETGVCEQLATQMLNYIQRHTQRPVWWKQPKFLVAGGMLGTSLMGYIIYEWVKRPDESVEPDLPTPPGPPK